jgi:hypothetical protein
MPTPSSLFLNSKQVPQLTIKCTWLEILGVQQPLLWTGKAPTPHGLLTISPKFPTASIPQPQIMMVFSSLKIKISSAALMITKLLTSGMEKDTRVTGTTSMMTPSGMALSHTS